MRLSAPMKSKTMFSLSQGILRRREKLNSLLQVPKQAGDKMNQNGQEEGGRGGTKGGVRLDQKRGRELRRILASDQGKV